jgi:hypothetical protein
MNVKTIAPLAGALGALLLGHPAVLWGQEAQAEREKTTAEAAAAEPAAQEAAPAPDDLEVDVAEPDFTIVNLPTTLRLPRHKLAFRVAHRFTRPLGQGDLGDLLGDAFGLDSSAQIGLELRFAIFGGTQIGFHRNNDRNIQFFLERNVVRQGESPLGIAIYGSIEGLDNFKKHYSPGIGVVISRKLGTRGALYVFPAWVGDTLTTPGPTLNTALLGAGARIRVVSSVCLVGEFVPRVGGFKGENPADPEERAAHQVSFAIEKRVGGHTFQLNFNNGFGTTPGQLARGASTGEDWYLGFNISRKFF